MVMVKETVNKFLSLSINNPRFEREFDAIIDLLMLERAKNTELTYDEAQGYINKLSAKREGIMTLPIRESFVAFKRDLIGFRSDRFVFQGTGLSVFLEARKICANFYEYGVNSLNQGKHKYNNTHIANYIKTKMTELDAMIKTNAESRWDVLADIRYILVTGCRNNVIDRERYKEVSKLVIALLYKEYKEYQQCNSQLQKMSLFEEINTTLIDFDEISLNLELYYLVDIENFYNKYTEYRNMFVSLLQQGKIDDKIFDHYNSKLNSAYDYYTNTSFEDYNILVTYQYMLANNISLDRLMAYNEDQIFKACKFSKEFISNFTNKSIETLVLTSRINSNHIYSKNQYVTDKMTNSLLIDSLELLRKYEVINVAQYFEYRDYLLGGENK